MSLYALMSRPSLCRLLLALLSCHHLVAAGHSPATSSRPKDEHNGGAAWHSFDRLLDARRGSHVQGLAELKRYLARFGYMPEERGGRTDAFDGQLEAAVELYQSGLGLPVTGRLDAVTLAQMMAPRCGVGDGRRKVGLALGRNGSVSRFAFFSGEPRWMRPEPLVLTYAVSPAATVEYLPAAALQAAFRRAFARWAEVIPVQFIEAADYAVADVKVAFYAGDHGDGEPFDGVLGVLAHAFSPESGLLHLDAAERWAVDFDADQAAGAVDLESVATHEIGHVLGLAHSASPEAVMYPSLKPRTKKVELTIDDVEGVQALYGSNPQFSFSSRSEPDMSAATARSPACRGCLTLRSSACGVCQVLVILLSLGL